MYINNEFIKRKNENIVILINLFILFSNASIIPSLKIIDGSTANNPIIIIITTIHKVLIISAKEYIFVAGSLDANI